MAGKYPEKLIIPKVHFHLQFMKDVMSILIIRNYEGDSDHRDEEEEYENEYENEYEESPAKVTSSRSARGKLI